MPEFQDVNDLERIKERFAEAGAPYLLDFLMAHAAGDAQTARWLANKLIPGKWVDAPSNKDAG